MEKRQIVYNPTRNGKTQNKKIRRTATKKERNLNVTTRDKKPIKIKQKRNKKEDTKVTKKRT